MKIDNEFKSIWITIINQPSHLLCRRILQKLRNQTNNVSNGATLQVVCRLWMHSDKCQTYRVTNFVLATYFRLFDCRSTSIRGKILDCRAQTTLAAQFLCNQTRLPLRLVISKLPQLASCFYSPEQMNTVVWSTRAQIQSSVIGAISCQTKHGDVTLGRIRCEKCETMSRQLVS